MSKEAALAWLENLELTRAGVQAKRFSLASLLVSATELEPFPAKRGNSLPRFTGYVPGGALVGGARRRVFGNCSIPGVHLVDIVLQHTRGAVQGAVTAQ